jgi:hypothetical protein
MLAAITTPMTPEQIEAFMNAKLLANVENINSTISNMVTLLGVAIALIGAIATFTIFQRKKIVSEVMAEVHKELDEEKQRIIRQADEKANAMIHEEILEYKQKAMLEEYYRNMMFKDLSTLLADEIHINDTNNLAEVFAKHADRYEIVAKLTSGKKKETREALKRLVKGDYKIIRLEAFKKYIEILERQKYDLYINEQLRALKKVMEENVN